MSKKAITAISITCADVSTLEPAQRVLIEGRGVPRLLEDAVTSVLNTIKQWGRDAEKNGNQAEAGRLKKLENLTCDNLAKSRIQMRLASGVDASRNLYDYEDWGRLEAEEKTLLEREYLELKVTIPIAAWAFLSSDAIAERAAVAKSNSITSVAVPAAVCVGSLIGLAVWASTAGSSLSVGLGALLTSTVSATLGGASALVAVASVALIAVVVAAIIMACKNPAPSRKMSDNSSRLASQASAEASAEAGAAAEEGEKPGT